MSTFPKLVVHKTFNLSFKHAEQLLEEKLKTTGIYHQKTTIISDKKKKKHCAFILKPLTFYSD